MDKDEHEFQIFREDLQHERSEYLNDRKLHIEAEHRAASGFDKTMTTLSAAALALSLTFSDSLNTTPELVEALYTAWAAFTLSLVSVLLSLYKSQQAFKLAQVNLEKEHLEESMRLKEEYEGTWSEEDAPIVEEKGNDNTSFKNRHSEWVGVLNPASLWLFAVGAICLITFSVVNFNNP